MQAAVTKLFAGLFLLLVATAVYAQPRVIDITSFANQKYIDTLVQYQLTDRGKGKISELRFAQTLPANIHAALPPSWVEKDLYLRFALANPSDSDRTVCFYPGVYFPEIEIFHATSAASPYTPLKAPDLVTKERRQPGYKLLTIAAQDTSTYVIRLKFLRTSLNVLVPQIFSPEHSEKHQAVLQLRRSQLDMATYIASGMLLMMIVYSLAVFLQNKNDEFIYYASYALCMGTLLFLISFLGTQPTQFNFFYTEYLDLIVLSSGVFFYFLFMRRFLNTRENHPFLEKLFLGGHYLIVTMLIIFSYIYFFTDEYILMNLLEDITKQFMLIIGVIFIIYGLRKKNKLMNYLVAGNIGMVIFSCMSFLILLTNITITEDPRFNLFNRPLFWYETGLTLELMLFLAGLAYKNKLDIIERVKERERLKLENERKEFEKQMAVITAQQEERNRISSDMHDELGSGVTAIRLMSEIVKSKLKDQSFAEIEKISNSANDLLGKMNTIIWTMKSSNDTLESLIAYIRAHAIEYFDSTPIECVVHTPEEIPAVDMSGEKRRNIFLSIKESLNNIMKHSQATLVTIDITTDAGELMISVDDNGIGIDTEKLRRFGNGLTNMRRRMEDINGRFHIQSGSGTTLLFNIPLH